MNGKVPYHKNADTELEMEGVFLYSLFETILELTVNERVAGNSLDQTSYRDLLTRIRNGDVTISDWELLITRTPSNCNNLDFFSDALRLSYGNKKVAEDNYNSLISLGNPVAKINAVHNKPAAAKFPSDDMGGLLSRLYLCVGARIMLTRNLWTEVGLCNGALGTVYSIIFPDNTNTSFPIAVIVKFDSYSGPSFLSDFDNCVPIPPSTSCSESFGSNFERTQFPLKLAWAITIHKSQGLTLPKAWVDLGDSERTPGLTYVALSRVKSLHHLVIEPFTYERLSSISKSKNLQLRLQEEQRLHSLAI